jgi:hypothetical protein
MIKTARQKESHKTLNGLCRIEEQKAVQCISSEGPGIFTLGQVREATEADLGADESLPIH